MATATSADCFICCAVCLCCRYRPKLDSVNRHLISEDGLVVPLSGAEYRLLQVLLAHPNRILNRDQLLDLTQGRESDPFDRSIDVLISRLRKRLGDDPKSPKIIKTVRGEGYILASKVSREGVE